jgi:hypothetical protein
MRNFKYIPGEWIFRLMGYPVTLNSFQASDIIKIDPEELFMAYSWQKMKKAGTQGLGKQFQTDKSEVGSLTGWIIIGVILLIILVLIWR